MHRFVLLLALGSLVFLAAVGEAQQAAPSAPPTLDYGFFKEKVQPLLLKKRPGHSKCTGCHMDGAGGFKLERLSPGATSWNEEQSRKNFQAIMVKVIPGNPQRSKLLIHPLRFTAGGDYNHAGGPQFSSAMDPDWLTIAAWVKGEKLGS